MKKLLFILVMFLFACASKTFDESIINDEKLLNDSIYYMETIPMPSSYVDEIIILPPDTVKKDSVRILNKQIVQQNSKMDSILNIKKRSKR